MKVKRIKGNDKYFIWYNKNKDKIKIRKIIIKNDILIYYDIIEAKG